MNLTAVMAEVAQAVAAVEGPVQVYVGAPPKVDPPARGAAAVVPYPLSVEYDGTYGRGMDTISQEVFLLLPRPTDPDVVVRLTSYAAGVGVNSIKEKIEAHTWQTCDGVRVVRADFEPVDYAGVPYMGGRWELEIWGPGGT